MNSIDKTIDLFANGGLNCAQSILTAFGKPYGIDSDTAKIMGRPLGGGVAVSGQICGFLIGAVQVLGYAYNETDEGEARSATHPKVAELLGEFQKKHGALTCNQLLGVKRGTSEGEEKIKKHNLVGKNCPNFGQDVAKILDTLLPNRSA